MNPRDRVNVILVSQNVPLCSGFPGFLWRFCSLIPLAWATAPSSFSDAVALRFRSSLSIAESVFAMFRKIKGSKFKSLKFKIRSSLGWAFIYKRATAKKFFVVGGASLVLSVHRPHTVSVRVYCLHCDILYCCVWLGNKGRTLYTMLV